MVNAVILRSLSLLVVVVSVLASPTPAPAPPATTKKRAHQQDATSSILESASDPPIEPVPYRQPNPRSLAEHATKITSRQRGWYRKRLLGMGSNDKPDPQYRHTPLRVLETAYQLRHDDPTLTMPNSMKAAREYVAKRTKGTDPQEALNLPAPPAAAALYEQLCRDRAKKERVIERNKQLYAALEERHGGKGKGLLVPLPPSHFPLKAKKTLYDLRYKERKRKFKKTVVDDAALSSHDHSTASPDELAEAGHLIIPAATTSSPSRSEGPVKKKARLSSQVSLSESSDGRADSGVLRAGSNSIKRMSSLVPSEKLVEAGETEATSSKKSRVELDLNQPPPSE